MSEVKTTRTFEAWELSQVRTQGLGSSLDRREAWDAALSSVILPETMGQEAILRLLVTLFKPTNKRDLTVHQDVTKVLLGKLPAQPARKMFEEPRPLEFVSTEEHGEPAPPAEGLTREEVEKIREILRFLDTYGKLPPRSD